MYNCFGNVLTPIVGRKANVFRTSWVAYRQNIIYQKLWKRGVNDIFAIDGYKYFSNIYKCFQIWFRIFGHEMFSEYLLTNGFRIFGTKRFVYVLTFFGFKYLAIECFETIYWQTCLWYLISNVFYVLTSFGF